MYGLRHKHIRIEDQQLNLEMNIMFSEKSKKSTIFAVTPIKVFSIESVFQTTTSLKLMLL